MVDNITKECCDFFLNKSIKYNNILNEIYIKIDERKNNPITPLEETD